MDKNNCTIEQFLKLKHNGNTNIKLFTVALTTPLDEVLSQMIQHNVHHILVVSANNHLEGVITEKDIRLAAESPLLHHEKDMLERMVEKLSKSKVEDIYTNNPKTVDHTDTVLFATKLMRVAAIGCLPVVKAGTNTVIDIITRTDLLDHLIRVLEPVDQQ